MSISEWLADLSILSVLGIIAFLLVLRFVLMRLRRPAAKSAAQVLESLAVAVALVFLLIRPFIVQAFFIPSGSMEPTLFKGDHIFVNKFIYRIGQPKRGDVVVFKSPPAANEGQMDFIKRVIGLPGDVVRITPGYVQVDDAIYDHQRLREELAPGNDGALVKLVDSKVFVDGREMSLKEVAEDLHQPFAKVRVFAGEVYVNGKALNEPYTAEDTDTPYPVPSTPDRGDIVKGRNGKWEIKIPAGKLLVMGDNRNDSGDARLWGLLDRRRIEGKAMFICWPPGRVKWIH